MIRQPSQILIRFFWIALMIQLPVMLYLFVRWLQTHGFWGGMKAWVLHGQTGPIFLFAEIDFIAMMLFVLVLCWREMTDVWKRSKTLWILWSVLFSVCPSIAFLIFVLVRSHLPATPLTKA